jgi:hypothetical protein
LLIMFPPDGINSVYTKSRILYWLLRKLFSESRASPAWKKKLVMLENAQRFPLKFGFF